MEEAMAQSEFYNQPDHQKILDKYTVKQNELLQKMEEWDRLLVQLS